MKNRQMMCLGVALLFACELSVAQNFPARAIRLVVGYGAGGAADLVSRLVAQTMSPRIGQQVIVENRPGAGGFIANEYVANVAPDGYTLLLTNSSFAYIPGMFKKTNFDIDRDFVQVARVATTSNLIATHPGVPVKNVRELIALAKKYPGKLNYASGGTGGATHLSTELFKSMTRTNIIHIAYKGNAPSIQDLITGRVDMTIAPIPALVPLVKSGKLRGLATTGAQRSPVLPDYPTVSESGVPGYEAGSWYGYSAPSKAPAPAINKLSTEIVALLKDKEFLDKLQNAVRLEPAPMGAKEFRDFVKNETIKWTKVITEAGIKAQ